MSELKMSVLVLPENMSFYEEIYTDGKNFTLPPIVPELTNLTSESTPQKKLGSEGPHTASDYD